MERSCTTAVVGAKCQGNSKDPMDLMHFVQDCLRKIDSVIHRLWTARHTRSQTKEKRRRRRKSQDDHVLFWKGNNQNSIYYWEAVICENVGFTETSRGSLEYSKWSPILSVTDCPNKLQSLANLAQCFVHINETLLFTIIVIAPEIWQLCQDKKHEVTFCLWEWNRQIIVLY